MLERRQARLGALDPDVDVQAGAELPSGRGASELDEPQVTPRVISLLGTAVGQVPAAAGASPCSEPPQRIQPQVAKLRWSSAASPQMPLASSTTAAMSSALIRSPSRISGGTRPARRSAVDHEELLLGAQREGRALAERLGNHGR